jgi:hypothetical protein
MATGKSFCASGGKLRRAEMVSLQTTQAHALDVDRLLGEDGRRSLVVDLDDVQLQAGSAS